ncbi:unnamed protein product [Onchocerca flexuosa]|uniref:Ovule protein n=1 Tax=Onchocerca flexuosa TaxID=387005 RepID=A0A183HB83_9BILA|nr:unnamed protein product [Onchocerca flexuosa]
MFKDQRVSQPLIVMHCLLSSSDFPVLSLEMCIIEKIWQGYLRIRMISSIHCVKCTEKANIAFEGVIPVALVSL